MHLSTWQKNALSTSKLPLGGLPRNSVVRITDRPDMTSAVYHGCRATNKVRCIFDINNGIILASSPSKPLVGSHSLDKAILMRTHNIDF